MSSSAVLTCRTGDIAPARTCPHARANPPPRALAAEVDSRTRMLLEQPIAGPAIVLQTDSTTVVPPGTTLIAEVSGNQPRT